MSHLTNDDRNTIASMLALLMKEAEKILLKQMDMTQRQYLKK